MDLPLSPEAILSHHYQPGTLLHHILYTHSLEIAQLAVSLAQRYGGEIDLPFVYEAALLHDIGIGYTNASSIACYGREPYSRHGYLGARLLREQWRLERHALVCERHTGSGISETERQELSLALPQGRCYLPQSIEEKVICYADCFYSKTHLGIRKSYEEVHTKMEAFWQKRAPHLKEEALARLEEMHHLFGDPL